MLFTPGPPVGTDTASRASLMAEIGEHSQIIPTTDATDRAQKVADLSGAGVTATTQAPFWFYRTDLGIIERWNGTTPHQFAQPLTHARFITTAQLAHGSGLWNLMPIDSKTDVLGEDVLSVASRTVTVPAGLWLFDAMLTMNGDAFSAAIWNGSTVLARTANSGVSNETGLSCVRRLSSTGSITLRQFAGATRSNLVASTSVPCHLSVTRLA